MGSIVPFRITSEEQKRIIARNRFDRSDSLRGVPDWFLIRLFLFFQAKQDMTQMKNNGDGY